MAEEKKQTDILPNLVILTDETGSMGRFLEAISQSLQEVFPMVQMTHSFNALAVQTYRDYGDPDMLRFSGFKKTFNEIQPFLLSLKPTGGGDTEEATKSAIWDLLKHLRAYETQSQCSTRETIVLLYTDAPPHLDIDPANPHKNHVAEKRALAENNKFSWDRCCEALKEQRVTVFPIVRKTSPNSWSTPDSVMYEYYHKIAQVTGGVCLGLIDTASRNITEKTINLLLGLLNYEHQPLPLMEKEHGTITDLQQFVQVRPSQIRPTVLPKHPECIDDVFDAFGQLLQNPSTLMALTTNALFGEFWRFVCRQRDNPRRELLNASLSNQMRNLKEPDLTTFKTWLEKSYDRTAEITDAIFAIPIEKHRPFLVLEADEKYTAQEILEVARSCSPAVVSRLTRMIANIRVISDPEAPLPEKYLPLALKDFDLFKMLPHLMAPGCLFSQRPAVILAVLTVYIKHPDLAERAKAYLSSLHGSWLDVTIPENYTQEFIKLMLREKETAALSLDPTQLKFFTDLKMLSGFMWNLQSKLEAKLPCTPSKKFLPDIKKPCACCTFNRSITLLCPAPEGDSNQQICGLCKFNPEMGKAAPEPNAELSCFVECHTCQGQYALIAPEMFGARSPIQAKCHFCRNKLPPSNVRCSTCHNLYVNSDQSIDPKDAQWQCRRCQVVPDQCFEMEQISLQQLFRENNWLAEALTGWVIKDNPDILQTRSLFKLKDLCKRNEPAYLFAEEDEKKVTSAPAFKWRKTIENQPAAIAVIRQWVLSNDFQTDSCMICCTDLHRDKLFSPCGRKKCTVPVCGPCGSLWFKVNAPGKVVLANHLLCPFCKQLPSSSKIRKWNPQLLQLAKLNVSRLLPTWWYGWCVACNQAKEIAEKSCAAEMPEPNRFTCQDCTELQSRGAAVSTKACPKCSIEISKAGGCNHITCICGCHFCYECGLQFDAYEIYDHLEAEHGGIGYDNMYEEGAAEYDD